MRGGSVQVGFLELQLLLDMQNFMFITTHLPSPQHSLLQKTPHPVDEFLALQVAYHKLSQGCICASSHIARCLGTPGFRIHAQTYMSLTDPGDGHVMGTTRKTEWMKGAIVHVEHLERPGHLPRSECESYRIPSLVDFAKVRLQVGSAAPTTVREAF